MYASSCFYAIQVTIEVRAEVGLLTRNVKIRGMGNPDYEVVIEACPKEADLSEWP